MTNTEIESKLSHTVTEYDRKQLQRHMRNPRRSYHNPYALGQYLKAVEYTMADVKLGMTIRAALVDHFTGKLLDVVLRSVGEPISTDKEQRIDGKFGF